MSASNLSEIRVVVLGRAGAGKNSTVSTILGQEGGATLRQECSKHTGQAAGRQVTVVSSTDWFGSSCVPEDRKRQLSSLLALSSPGPHAVLLCVPLNQPADGETKALDVLEKLLGQAMVQKHTIVMFTHTEELDHEEGLEDYLLNWRKDLTELVRRCGDRYHTLETQPGRAEPNEAVRELLDKVDQVVMESGEDHFSCQLYQDIEEQIQKRQREIVRQRQADGLDSEDEEGVRLEAENSIGDIDLSLDALFPCSDVQVSQGSFLWRLWEKLTSWVWGLPKLVRREALLGALVGLFVGGPVGGAVGATVGSVATEVGRRKTQKTK
ncbi:GTPase IMAP family member 9 isoform X2 [Boleophthalmus pectinirostris]|uniref:GTPase IMAP family member 9 isoform X2 n=1 Tax=Boleophthalmus pectinirostris TaxID=150288 RepID=UPI000A1C74C1|nr:GTPase IMAP family member 9 isoform X2 [Boleophthalmus pectinirostris]